MGSISRAVSDDTPIDKYGNEYIGEVDFDASIINASTTIEYIGYGTFINRGPNAIWNIEYEISFSSESVMHKLVLDLTVNSKIVKTHEKNIDYNVNTYKFIGRHIQEIKSNDTFSFDAHVISGSQPYVVKCSFVAICANCPIDWELNGTFPK